MVDPAEMAEWTYKNGYWCKGSGSYIIPPNFIETGTLFGSMFKAWNAIETGILAVSVGIPVFVFLPLGLTARIIVLCLTALPLALLALIGVSGESLSSFLVIFLKYMRNRRVIGGEGEKADNMDRFSAKEGKGHKKRVRTDKLYLNGTYIFLSAPVDFSCLQQAKICLVWHGLKDSLTIKRDCLLVKYSLWSVMLL